MLTSLAIQFGGAIIASDSFGPGPDSYNLGPPLTQEAAKPPFRPKVAGRIGFFFGVVAGALVSVVNLRRMGHAQKANKIMWITLLAALALAGVIILVPDGLVRLATFASEIVWYVIFPKIQDQEFGQWVVAHENTSPSNGWGALGWGFVGLFVFFVIGIVMSILLVSTGILPQ
jgi:hypothetical protein